MKRKIALGPGAASLILIVVILSLCMLSMLMQIGARNDVSLASRSTEMITNVYELYARAERRLAKLDAFLLRCEEATGETDAYLDLVEQNLPEGFTIQDTTDGKIISWQDPLDRRVLTSAVKLLPLGGAERTMWVVHTLAEPSQRSAEEEEFPQ